MNQYLTKEDLDKATIYLLNKQIKLLRDSIRFKNIMFYSVCGISIVLSVLLLNDLLSGV